MIVETKQLNYMINLHDCFSTVLPFLLLSLLFLCIAGGFTRDAVAE